MRFPSILVCAIGLFLLLDWYPRTLPCQAGEDSKPGAAATNSMIKASVVVHSGEPDPGWIFTNAVEIAKLKNFITGLPVSPPPKWPILGFRGFMLTAKDENSG